MRDIEARVARGFDAATEPYIEQKDPNHVYTHEIPACMFKV